MGMLTRNRRGLSPRLRGNPDPGRGERGDQRSIPVKRAKTQLLTDTFQLPLRSRASKHIKHPSDTKLTKKRQTPKDPKRKKPASDPQQRRDYDRARSQTPERKEYNRQRRRQERETNRQTGRCRYCPNTALPGSGRCQVCTEKHRQYSADRRARQKAQRELDKQALARIAPTQVPHATEEPDKAMRKCKHCSQTAIPGQTRCESCAEKHRISRRKNDKARRARQKAEGKLTSNDGA